MNLEKSKAKFPAGLLWSLTVFSWLIYIIWALDWFGGDMRIVSTIILLCSQFLCWIVFIIDIASSEIFNKAAWIIMIVLLPLITYPIYLVQRRRLIRIQDRKNNFAGNKEN